MQEKAEAFIEEEKVWERGPWETDSVPPAARRGRDLHVPETVHTVREIITDGPLMTVELWIY